MVTTSEYKLWERLYCHLCIWVFKFAYLIRIRKPINDLQKYIRGEHKAPRTPLPPSDHPFLTPQSVVRYAYSKFEYRKDRVKIDFPDWIESRVGQRFFLPLDWITDADVFHYRLLTEEIRDGDCDDYHNFVAQCLALREEVDEVYLCYVGYRGGGHVVCAFKSTNQWYLVDYRTTMINSLDDIAPKIAAKYSKDKSSVIYFWVVETVREPGWRAKQIGYHHRT